MQNTIDWAMPDQRSLENPSTPLSDPDDWLGDLLGGGRTPSGVVVNDETILTYSPIVRGINLIANLIARLPTRVMKRLPEGGKAEDPSHFAYDIVRWEPNSEDTAFVFKQTMQAQALIRGNAYSFIERLPNGNATQTIPLPSRQVWPVRVDGIKFYLFDTGSELRKLEPINVLHIRGLGLDSLLGLDTVAKSRESVGLGLAMQKYSALFFGNDARPSIAIEIEGTPSEADQKVLRENWGAIHGGLNQSHKVALLTGGMQVKPFSAGAKESQLIESRQFSLVDVANWLNMPVHKVGGEGRTAFASLEQENRSFLDDTIAPWLTTWEQEYRRKILTEEEKRSDSHLILFKVQGLLAADVRTVSEVLTSEVNNGLLNADEARAIQDRPPLPNGEGKRFRKPENIGFVDDDDTEGDTSDDERTARLKQSTTRALADATGRMARRLVTHARKAAKNYRRFDDWLETIEAQHRQVVVETMTTAVDAMYDACGGVDDAACVLRSTAVNIAVGALFDGITARLDKCLETSERETFAADVDAALADFGITATAEAIRNVHRHVEESKSWKLSNPNDANPAVEPGTSPIPTENVGSSGEPRSAPPATATEDHDAD